MGSLVARSHSQTLDSRSAWLYLRALYVFCGDNRDRTGNLRLARAALSQLSYIPMPRSGGPFFMSNKIGPFCSVRACFLVGLGGIEPPTSRLSGVRSNHLSYRPTRNGTETKQNKPFLLSFRRP
jgi:hypothetical protein